MAKNLSKLKDHAAAAMARARKPNLGGGGPCRKHPKHKQSPGVCSLCLREKLCQLVNGRDSTAKNKIASNSDPCSSSSVSSLSSYYSSSSASSCCSPPAVTARRKSSISAMFKRKSSAGNFLSGSRSVTAGDGFWSKLVMNHRRGKEIIVEETLGRSASTITDHHRIIAT